MIINWTGSGVKVIPCIGNGGQTVSKIILLPGNNDVDKNNWLIARVHVLDEIKSKSIIETVAAEVVEKVVEVDEPVLDPKTNEPVIDPETKKAKSKKVKVNEVKINTTEFKKLSIEKASEIISDTFNLETLKEWKKDEGRDSIRAELQNQIESVENFNEDKKKKLKKDKE